jgi:hypothetical protein
MRSKTIRVDEQALAFVSTAKIDRTLLPERKKEEKNDGAASKTFLWNEHSGTGPCGAALAQRAGMEGQLLLSLDERPVKTVTASGAASFFSQALAFFIFLFGLQLAKVLAPSPEIYLPCIEYRS